jgi:hypothetical protein
VPELQIATLLGFAENAVINATARRIFQQTFVESLLHFKDSWLATILPIPRKNAPLCA